VCVAGALLLSLALFGAKDTWGAWHQKTEIHESGPSSNDVGVRTLYPSARVFSRGSQSQERPRPVARMGTLAARDLSARQPLYYLAFLLAAALALIACRGRRLEQVCLIGLLLVPFYSCPPKHLPPLVFLLPLIVAVAGAEAERERNFAGAPWCCSRSWPCAAGFHRGPKQCDETCATPTRASCCSSRFGMISSLHLAASPGVRRLCGKRKSGERSGG